MAGEQFSGIIMMVVLFALMYFMMIRPQKKKDKEVKAMRDNLTIGDEVITIGGIHGKVVKVNDEIIVLEMLHAKQRIEFSKWAVGSVVKKGKDKANTVEEVEEPTDTTEEE
jgi:preprotein translocase subunit YajC